MARLLHGKPLADAVAAALGERIGRLTAEGRAPTLAAISLSPDPPSRIYAERLQRVGGKLGVRVVVRETTEERGLQEAIARANEDRGIHGVIVLAPLPTDVDVPGVMERIDPAKDVDGLHPYNVGRLAIGRATFIPSTAEAIFLLVRQARPKLTGARAVVVGRSLAVGRPAALLLMGENATVTLAHRGTHHLDALTREAEVLVVAAGQPGIVHGEVVREGAIVIDAGINATPDGIVGDVDFASTSRVASVITPVPGGVGSLTTMLLLRNVVEAAERQR